MAIAVPKLEMAAKLGKLLSKPKARVEVAGPWGSAKTLVAAQAAKATERSLLYVCSGRLEAEAVYDDLCTFAGEEQTALLPSWEVLPTDTMNPADDIVAERMETLKRLALAKDNGDTLHAVVPVRSLLQYVIHRKRLVGDTLTLRAGEEIDLDAILEKLVRMGYTREVMVENRGDVSVRGGIVDLFPISAELPYRLELFGDEIETIRCFEPETQRSVSHEEEVRILPRSEKAMIAEGGDGLSFVSEYFGKNTLVVFDEYLRVQEEVHQILQQHGDNKFIAPWETADERLAKWPHLMVAQVGMERREGVERMTLPTVSLSGWVGQTDDFWQQLERWNLDGFTVRLLCVNSGERRRLHELLEEKGHRLDTDDFDLRVDLGRLNAGFTLPDEKLAVLSEKEMFGRRHLRRKRRRFEAGAAITQFSDLKAGDYVVHETHGIGHYLGLKRFPGRSADYMAVQYRGGDTMYVPVTQIDQVQKYVAGEGAVPRVDKIGGASWRNAKAKVKKAVREITEQLVRLYAKRDQAKGHAYAPDTPWQQEFEDAFEYDETPDQLRAIAEVKADMESSRPMDRLLCGDVGFGKTEVALRAAFKAVQDGKQVALLAPTTVLTQQHYETFRERMADFPVRIELLNRFRTPKQQKETVERVRSGEVDIIIGTHRITSKDIHFKDLGLVIVDEEQRFGVTHKERLKEMRSQVDYLTLSATPIPRTLHFSLIGVRDMSAINTAPNDRLPIHTAIEPWDTEVIREAIEREMAREGQVFFLHNRVQTIEQVAAKINELVPRARIAVGHGQMHKHELEEVMVKFVERDLDVLVCTTIIGSGIDIPNANTIIIDRADHFGLSELYQIRGRVGRYKHRAFAYLLVPGDRALTEEAQLRLQALEDFSTLGSGFRIAMRDLEIRGAGNLLGADQSGHISLVGYETYRELIAEAVAEHRGEPVRHITVPPFDIKTDAHIPDDYVPTGQQKMTLYRRISQLKTPDEVREMSEELKDRFGQPPGPVRRLLDIMRARTLAAEIGAKSITAAKGAVVITLESARLLDHRRQGELRQAFGGALTIDPGATPSLRFAIDGEEPAKAVIPLLNAMAE